MKIPYVIKFEQIKMYYLINITNKTENIRRKYLEKS